MTARRCPAGNVLLDRMHWQNGAFYRVAGTPRRWVRLSARYRDAVREWSRLERGHGAVRTVGPALEAYLEQAELAPTTRQTYDGIADRLAVEFGPCRLDELGPRDIRDWLHSRAAPVSANRDMALLRAVYNHAIEMGWTDENPAAKVRRRKERPRRRIASPDELAALAHVAPPIWRALLAVSVLTGMRPGELRTLRRSSLTDDGIELVREKTGAESLIEWSPALREAVDAATYAQDVPSVYVFPAAHGGPYGLKGFTKAWSRLRARAGIDGLQMRDMRRTAATMAESLAAASALLGHSSPAITQRVYRIRDRVKPTR